MTTGPIGPGTVLAGRYRLDDLLAENDGARFWRATDTILARSVAIHAVPSDDPRAPALLEAARVSATVIDTHLLRVLDCDDSGEITWVVNEWGDGVSLDLMLQRGTLPPSRAAWLTREVAEAIAAGHAQGVAHGRLNPEAVLVTHAGAVKIIGYVVDASLQPPRAPDPLYGELTEREADVINLAGILYAALTGRWPGVTVSTVPRAPRESRRPLRPRQVRAGVPRALDAICELVLHKEGSRHAMSIETAQEVAAALADYIGDPALMAPIGPAGIHVEPTVSINREAPFEAAPSGGDTDPEATRVAVPLPAEPDATQTFRASDPPALEGPDTLAPMHAPNDPPALPAPFPELPERPLYATTERRVPAGVHEAPAAGPGSGWAPPHPGTAHPDALGEAPGAGGAVPPGSWDHGASPGFGPGSGQPGYWPFTEDPEEENENHTGREGRGWLRIAIVIGVLLVVLVAMAIAFTRGRHDATPTAGGPGSPPGASKARGAPVKIVGVRDFDPFASPPRENPASAPNAIDGDPSTSWMTSTYRGNPALGGLKSGVGLMLDLGSTRAPRSLTVRFRGVPTSFEVYAASSGVTQSPDSLDQLTKVATRAGAPARATVALNPAPKTRYLLIWLTRLPAVPGGYRGEITDVAVTS